MESTKVITKSTILGEVIDTYGQEAAAVLLQYGIHCVGCAFNSYDSVEAGAKLHGFSDAEVEHLVADLNKVAKSAIIG